MTFLRRVVLTAAALPFVVGFGYVAGVLVGVALWEKNMRLCSGAED